MGLFSKRKEDKPDVPMISSGNLEQLAEKKQARKDLNALVLQYIHEGVVIVGEDLNIQLANPAAERMFGKNHDEIINLRYDSSIKLLDKNNTAVTEKNDPILFAINNGQMGETRDFQLVTQDSNKVTPVSIIITPTNGKNSSSIVTFRDITQQMKEEEEKNTFISTASHEMRTPVASIEGYLGLAMNPATATIDERAMSYLQKAHEASQHLGHLFQDLLDTTKMDDGKAKLNLVPVELASLVSEIAEGHLAAAQAKQLDFRFAGNKVDSTVNGGRTINQLIYARLDINYFREIIDNLIENAIKYTPSGTVSVNTSADSSNVIVSVADSGIGIPSEELTHVFQKFYRVDNRDTREIGGTGLGLYLVKQRTELMGGRIWVESTVNKGSTFFVSFPRMDEATYQQAKFAMDNIAMQKQNNELDN